MTIRPYNGPSRRRMYSGGNRMIPWIVLCMVLWVMTGETGAGSQKSTRKMRELANQMKACEGDMACIQRISRQIQELQQQIQNQTPGSNPAGFYQAMKNPCRHFPKKQAKQRCLPVKVQVFSRSKERVEKRLRSGGRGYTSHYLVFEYRAEGRGRMLYSSDFSDFTLMAFGSEKTTDITEFNGYWQKWNRADRYMEEDTYRTGMHRIKNPFQLSVNYPLPKKSRNIQTNLELSPVRVETMDELIPAHGGGRIRSRDKGIKPFIITPKRMRSYVKKGGFEKTFLIQSRRRGGRHRIDHEITIKVRFGKRSNRK